MNKKIIAGMPDYIDDLIVILKDVPQGNNIAKHLLTMAKILLAPEKTILHKLTFKDIPKAVNANVGSPNSIDNNNPVHQINLPAFKMSETPITNNQWQTVALDPRFRTILPKYPSSTFSPAFKRDDHPVVNITWYDAIKYSLLCNIGNPTVPMNIQNQIWTPSEGFKISDKNLGSFVMKMQDSRIKMILLPTESQWEYAADKDPEEGYLIISNKDDSTQPVRSIPPNRYGLYDMTWNVWEWTTDWYLSDFYKEGTTYYSPLGPKTGRTRVLRGGSWFEKKQQIDSKQPYNGVWSNYRNDLLPSEKGNHYGFRLVQN